MVATRLLEPAAAELGPTGRPMTAFPDPKPLDHHGPARIVAVADIPRTKSGKISELAVRNVVHGQEVGNHEALANPEALQLFAGLPELTR